MSGIARALLAAALLNCGLLTASAASAGGGGQWLNDGACALFDADAHAGDTVSWTGSCTNGYAEGLGTATFTHDGQTQSFTAFFQHGLVPDGHVISRWGQGWRYSGEAVGGRYNGIGILTTDANDRFEGRWVDGKMTGFGVLLRPDGERYAGDWKDDKPDGNGEFRNANGTVVRGLFQDGKLVKAETSVEGTTGSGDLANQGVNQSANQNANQSGGPFGGVSGKTLTGVDGSSIALTLIDGGMELQVVPADGNARKTTFTFMTDRMGTVVENSGSRGSSVTGFFRLTAKGVEVRYADGHSAMLSANSDGGVQMALDGDAGSSCSAWYPAGHLFSDSDKKIALNAYASKLGLPVAAADTGNGCSPAPQAANVAPPTPSSAPSAATAPRAHPERHADAKAPMAKASYHVGDYQRTKALEPVAVKTSQIHPIDSDAIAVPSATALSVSADKNNASACLKVDSDGDHWGFRNTCSFAVQFAYCMAGDIACGAKGLVTGATGSVAANGFGALMTDTSLKEKDAAHNFRWVACGGGAGEVVAHLDAIEPPAGHCERTASAN
jgi:hypothetical protein